MLRTDRGRARRVGASSGCRGAGRAAGPHSGLFCRPGDQNSPQMQGTGAGGAPVSTALCLQAVCTRWDTAPQPPTAARSYSKHGDSICACWGAGRGLSLRSSGQHLDPNQTPLPPTAGKCSPSSSAHVKGGFPTLGACLPSLCPFPASRNLPGTLTGHLCAPRRCPLVSRGGSPSGRPGQRAQLESSVDAAQKATP